MRSQANSKSALTDNPTPMRLRELEIRKQVAENRRLNILPGNRVLGDRGLTAEVVNASYRRAARAGLRCLCFRRQAVVSAEDLRRVMVRA